MASFSSISNIVGCKRRGILSRHYKGIEKKTEALSFGSSYHEAVENGLSAGLYMLESEGINTDKNVELLKTMYARLQKFLIQNNIKILEHEIEFHINYDGIEEEFMGYVDGVVEYCGEHYLLELKTARSIDVSATVFDSQLTAYMYASRMHPALSKYNPKGILYVVNQKSLDGKPTVLASGKLSVAKNQGCTPEDYIAKAVEIYGDDIPPEVELHIEWLENNYQPKLVCVNVKRTDLEINEFASKIEGYVKDIQDMKELLENGIAYALKNTPYFPSKHCFDTCYQKENCLQCHLAMTTGNPTDDDLDATVIRNDA